MAIDIANKTSRYCFAYQAAAGTPAIDEVDSVSYFFGEYNDECGDWNTPFKEQPVGKYHVYGTRTPKLIDMNSKYPTFSHTFLPTSCQPYAWILKLPETATPMTIVALETGLGVPLTVRCEEKGGTNPTGTQASDCYCIGLTTKAERGKELMVEGVFAWGKLQDVGASGDEPILTTAPLKPAGEAANEITGTYEGNPEIVWDVGVDNHTVSPVWKAEWISAQEYASADSDEGITQTVFTYQYDTVKIILTAIMETDEMWDDYMDRKATTNMTIKLWKHDRVHYILATFTNCRIVTTKKTGHRNKGHYGTVCAIEAEKVEYSSNWLAEYNGADGDFGDHFKAGI